MSKAAATARITSTETATASASVASSIKGPISAGPQSNPSVSATVSVLASYGDEFALTSRRAARLNATTAAAESDAWMAERNLLLGKLFSDEITDSEQARLRYVNWNLDRIEDARTGEILDVLEGFALKYEQFRDDLRSFKSQLDALKR